MSRNIDRVSVPLKEASIKLEAVGREVAQSEAAVDVSSPESVEAHNELVHQYHAMVEEYNSTTPMDIARLNTNVDKMNATVVRFNVQCAEQAYYIHDMEAVEKELGLAHAEPNK